MNLPFLSNEVNFALNCIKNKDKIYEIRIKENYGIKIVYGFKKYFLCENGLTEFENNSIKITFSDIEEIISKLTKRSFYAYNDRIKQGFLTYEGGVRIGLAGECVFEKEIITIKNINSLAIRIPHEILDCSNYCYKYIKNYDYLYNTLIISPPFCGKTTILKDVVRKLNLENKYNILVIDERGEFCSVKGANVDSILYSDKFYAFTCGLKSMAPDIVVTDELITDLDWKMVKSSISCGVKIIASCHAESIENLKDKEFFLPKIFDRVIVLENNRNLIGRIKAVYNKNFERII